MEILSHERVFLVVGFSLGQGTKHTCCSQTEEDILLELPQEEVAFGCWGCAWHNSWCVSLPGGGGGGQEHPVTSLDYVTLNKVIYIFLSLYFPAINGDMVDIANVS